MNLKELIEEIKIEFENLDLTVQTINDLNGIIGFNKPNRIQIAAMNQFISEFYTGIENILKRICKSNNVVIPYGADSHIRLFQMFKSNADSILPAIFDSEIEDEFTKIRKFRHFVMHGYSFKVDWDFLKDSVHKIDEIYNIFKKNTLNYLSTFD